MHLSVRVETPRYCDNKHWRSLRILTRASTVGASRPLVVATSGVSPISATPSPKGCCMRGMWRLVGKDEQRKDFPTPKHHFVRNIGDLSLSQSQPPVVSEAATQHGQSGVGRLRRAAPGARRTRVRERHVCDPHQGCRECGVQVCQGAFVTNNSPQRKKERKRRRSLSLRAWRRTLVCAHEVVWVALVLIVTGISLRLADRLCRITSGWCTMSRCFCGKPIVSTDWQVRDSKGAFADTWTFF